MDVSVTIFTQNPPGTSIDYRGGAVQFGYLLEDGSVVSRVTYDRLFEKIGTEFGAGDGSTTFKLPDSRGKGDIGAGQGSGLTLRTIGQSGGAETHQLTEAELASHTHAQNPHNHGVTDPGHIHSLPIYEQGSAGTQAGGGGGDLQATRSTGSSMTNISVNNSTALNQSTGGNAAHNNMQPWIAATKMIKY